MGRVPELCELLDSYLLSGSAWEVPGVSVGGEVDFWALFDGAETEDLFTIRFLLCGLFSRRDLYF